MYSAAKPAATIPNSSSAVRWPTISGRLARCAPSAGIWEIVKASRSLKIFSMEPVAPSPAKAVSASAGTASNTPIAAVAIAPSAARLPYLDPVIAFPSKDARKPRANGP